MSSVRVAVRVRPFNKREKDRKAKLIIQMKDKATQIIAPNSGKKVGWSPQPLANLELPTSHLTLLNTTALSSFSGAGPCTGKDGLFSTSV